MEELLEELYLLILSKGPGYMNYSNIEFWDPTLNAVELYEQILERTKNDKNYINTISGDRPV